MKRYFNWFVFSIAAMASIPADKSNAQIRDWNTSGGQWSDIANWSPNQVPGITEIARIGFLPQAEDADVQLDIDTFGGYTLGDEHDFLIVGEGPATLDGTLDVLLIDAGSGLFSPLVGDEFTILTSLDGVFGTFDNSPVSFADGNAYHWDVLYESHNVTLRLDSINGVPEPGTVAFIIAAVFPLVLRRPARIVARHAISS